MNTIKSIKSYISKNAKSIILFALIFSVAISVTVSAIDERQAVRDLQNSVLRLHVLANSDDENDQAIKLKVRDFLMQNADIVAGNGKNITDVTSYAVDNIKNVENKINQYLESIGTEQRCTAKLERKYFPTKNYGEYTYPAGDYNALVVYIGKGEGKNWWCVMFPPLCLVDGVVVCDEKILRENGITPKQIGILKKDVSAGFYFWELIKKWKIEN